MDGGVRTRVVSSAGSLVNKPHFSCAHISQSAHARDEGAGKPERNVAAKIN